MFTFPKPRPKKSPLPPAPSKKRKATHTVEEIAFDDSARSEYLTGFHKRKVQRQKHAQKEAAERARQDRIVMRKEVCNRVLFCTAKPGTSMRTKWTNWASQIREERRQAVEDHVKNIEALLKENRVAGLDSEEEGHGSDHGDEKEWGGIDDAAQAPAPALEPVGHEEEYVDEDLYTTVKIEAVSIDRDGLHNKAELEAEDEDKGSEDVMGEKNRNAKGPDDKVKRSWKDQPKKKKKKFRYGTKLERQATNRKNNAGKGKPRA